MESHALVRSLVASVRFWLGFHGCGTSLLYRVPRSQSGARESSSVRHLLVRVHGDAAQCYRSPSLLSGLAVTIMWLGQPQ
jgi:hypothetical protein